MKILNESSIYKPAGIKIVEDKMNAKYVCESCLRNRDGGWANVPVAIFYTELAHPEGSNYFGIYNNIDGRTTITNAISATEPFSGLLIDNEVVYSRYRHDFREHNGIFVDGGRDYLKFGGERIDQAEIVKIQIVKDHLEIVTN
jgi:hypothetical protein